MTKFKNFKWIVCLAMGLLAGSAAYGQDNVIDEVVWVVGDEAIWKSEVEEMRLDAMYNGRRFERDPYCEIPEELAVRKLFLHQAALDSIEVSESEVIRMLDSRINYYIANIGSREKMEEYFNKTSTQLRETLRESIREELKVSKMRDKLMGDVEVKITPAEVRRYFNKLPQDSIPFIPTQVEVQIITQQPKVPLEEIEDVKRRLREYTERVNKGESFSMLARLYSEDRGTAMRGGEVDFTGRGMLDPAYANVAFNLQDPNKVSKIVESEYGFHIIQLMEKRGDRIKTRHILLKPHIPEEALQAANARLDSIADDIRNNKFTFEDAASVLSHDKDTRNNHGLLPNPNTNTSKFEMQELPPEIAKVVDKMKVGEISEAFTMIPQNTGKQVCVIVKLKSRVNGHKATITDDYQNLKNVVLEKRREEMLDKWIREKQKQTYVRISENWKNNCTFKYPGWIKD
ncbi:MAG: peptidylprolyl isomerase [Bacteroides sp.]|nr:peptidylprolyl isomerase [Bacteroides sp.]